MKIELNKSKTYILPLLFEFVNIQFVKQLVNTFLSYEDNILYLMYDTSKFSEKESKQFFAMEYEYKNNKFFASEQIVNDYFIFGFYLPEKTETTVALFVQGKYSEFPLESKYIILNFLNTYFPMFGSIIKEINGVLFKEEYLRLKIEESLGTKIDPSIELSSKPDLEKENISYILTNN